MSSDAYFNRRGEAIYKLLPNCFLFLFLNWESPSVPRQRLSVVHGITLIAWLLIKQADPLQAHGSLHNKPYVFHQLLINRWCFKSGDAWSQDTLTFLAPSSLLPLSHGCRDSFMKQNMVSTPSNHSSSFLWYPKYINIVTISSRTFCGKVRDFWSNDDFSRNLIKITEDYVP